jgi:hypothetical protein
MKQKSLLKVFFLLCALIVGSTSVWADPTYEWVLVEDYSDALSHDIAKNMPDSIFRNDFLSDMAQKWVDDIESSSGLKGKFSINCSNRGSLPHWREFKLKCGNKELILYPNGGIINEWFFDRLNDTAGLTMDTISHLDKIPLVRRKDVMYDAEIKDC